MSSAELSIDISRLVSRARNGEAIDTKVEGEALAARYPGLGMSADLIGKAIDRAASMMGVPLNGAVTLSGETADPADNADPSLHALPPALDGQAFAPQAPSPIVLASGRPDVSAGEAAGAQGVDDPAGAAEVQPGTPALAKPVAAMRRAFFGG